MFITRLNSCEWVLNTYEHFECKQGLLFVCHSNTSRDTTSNWYRINFWSPYVIYVSSSSTWNMQLTDKHLTLKNKRLVSSSCTCVWVYKNSIEFGANFSALPNIILLNRNYNVTEERHYAKRNISQHPFNSNKYPLLITSEIHCGFALHANRATYVCFRLINFIKPVGVFVKCQNKDKVCK